MSADVLIVGAGPTGLALAAQLSAFGTSYRIVDRQLDRARESRALAVQPRTLEVLTGIGAADLMVERGNPAVRLHVHSGARTTRVPLFDIGLDDTAYPFLLFLSQAETEAILDEHLAGQGTTVERGVELVSLRQEPDHIACTLRHRDGRHEELTTRYVAGCDGAHSTVRTQAGIGFTGRAYPQTFVLADLHAEGVDTGAVHVYLSPAGMLFLFPLGHPAPWRLLAMQPDAHPDGATAPGPDLSELQSLIDTHTDGHVRLHEPVWTTYFRLHNRYATRYRSRRVFLAGDAAHIHSPAGAQGMNTGIQDAWNLGWKLALVANGTAHPDLLDSYQTERQPIGRDVLRFTDRAFTIATSTNVVVRLLRTHVAPRLLRVGLGFTRGRAAGFRTISQLAIHYRHSPAVQEGHPRLRHGPHPGDRLPDAPITADGQPTTLHRALATPSFHLLLTGPPDTWPTGDALLDPRHAALVDVHHLTRHTHPATLIDVDGHAHHRLGLDRTDNPAHHLIRPDGHIAYRAAGTDTTGLHAYLSRWLPG